MQDDFEQLASDADCNVSNWEPKPEPDRPLFDGEPTVLADADDDEFDAFMRWLAAETRC